jgi:hypothetical protein
MFVDTCNILLHLIRIDELMIGPTRRRFYPMFAVKPGTHASSVLICGRSQSGVNTHPAAEQRSELKPRARLCEGNNIVDESQFAF